MEIFKIITEEDLQHAFAIRKSVFVEEQEIPLENEFDCYDTLLAEADHVLVQYERQAAGTGRMRITEGAGKLERICVLKQFRTFGLGKEIIQALEDIAVLHSLEQVKLHAQAQARGYYEKLGYSAASEIFMEDGIPHIVMVKPLMSV
ncbi:GNAT family N-acetyltransferase [Bacillus sp. 1P06AnD]|uniref:GNAT family N-acetyltransferase n=1 Tax=Bacillus sp. 1P06AnD TaxID=3132208 RepID=UPI00399EF21A